MGVLRIKEPIDIVLERDPFDLVSEVDGRPARRSRPDLLAVLTTMLVVVSGIAGFALWHSQERSSVQPVAYFEIKVIDPDGRPAVGALVKQGDASLGVTDSFGEWRRVMRVRRGGSVALTIVKSSGDGVLRAEKVIAVPRVEDGRGAVDIVGAVQLERVAGQVAAKPTPAPPAAVSAPVVAAAAPAISPVPDASPPAAPPAAALPTPPTPPAVVPGAGELDWSTVRFTTAGAASPLLVPVLSALSQRAQELGLTVKERSALEVRLAEVGGGGPAVRLIKVEGFRLAPPAAPRRLFAFLRRQGDAPLATARDILWSMNLHAVRSVPVERSEGGVYVLASTAPQAWAIGRGAKLVDDSGAQHVVVERQGDSRLQLVKDVDPCQKRERCTLRTAAITEAAPMAGWHRLPFKVRGPRAAVDIFVSGYLAQPVTGEEWTYWGMPRAPINVAVFRAGRLILRQRLEVGAGAGPLVTVPSPALSRR